MLVEFHSVSRDSFQDSIFLARALLGSCGCSVVKADCRSKSALEIARETGKVLHGFAAFAVFAQSLTGNKATGTPVAGQKHQVQELEILLRELRSGYLAACGVKPC